MTKAVIYLRSATANQEQTDRQEASCRSYLRERGLRASRTFRDDGHPGPALAQLLDAAANGEVTDVAIAGLDRLGRRFTENLDNVTALELAGVTIHTAAGIIAGPISDSCVRSMLYKIALVEAELVTDDDTRTPRRA